MDYNETGRMSSVTSRGVLNEPVRLRPASFNNAGGDALILRWTLCLFSPQSACGWPRVPAVLCGQAPSRRTAYGVVEHGRISFDPAYFADKMKDEDYYGIKILE